MKLNNQEEFIKDKMQSFNPEVDTNALWDSLEIHVPKKKKRRGFIFFLLASSIVLIGLLTLLIKNIDSSDSDITFPNKELVNAQNDKNENLSFNKPKTNKLNLSIANKKSQNNSNEEYQIKHKTLILKPNKTQSIQKSITNAKNDVSKQKNIVLKENYSITEATSQKSINTKIVILTIISKLKLLPLDNKRNLMLLPKTDFNYHFNRKNYFTLNMGISLGFVEQKFHAKTPESENYSDYLTSISNSKPALGFDFGLNYHFSKRFFLNSGIKVKRLTTEVHSKMTQLLNEENETPEGLVQRVTKQIEYEAIGHNYHYLVNLPINIGLNILENNKVKIGFQSGVSLNLFTNSNGKMINKSYRLYSYKNTTNNYYESRFSIGWQSSVMIDYKMQNNFYLYINPRFSQQSIKYNIDNIFINEFYSIFDINVGLKYRI